MKWIFLLCSLQFLSPSPWGGLSFSGVHISAYFIDCIPKIKLCRMQYTFIPPVPSCWTISTFLHRCLKIENKPALAPFQRKFKEHEITPMVYNYSRVKLLHGSIHVCITCTLTLTCIYLYFLPSITPVLGPQNSQKQETCLQHITSLIMFLLGINKVDNSHVSHYFCAG